MTYAIIETGGKQLRVEPGRFYDVERLSAEPEAAIVIDRVLYVESDGEISVGQPFVEGATIQATVMQHLRGRKIIVYKMRPKKKTRKKQGHRQELTRLMIDSIDLGGTASAASQPQAAAKAAEVAEPAKVAEVAEPAKAAEVAEPAEEAEA
jgi:large subunit ribosomal protein L21